MNTAQAIGQLTAQIEAMNSRLDRDREDRMTSDALSAKSRSETKAALEDLKDGHRDILRRVDKIEPVTEMVTGWKARAMGAVAVLGLIGSFLIAGLTFFKEPIVKFFAP